jgi:hypothetical protein
MRANTRKVQATVTGYTEWALKEMADANGWSSADVVRYVLDKWVDEPPKYLEQLGVSRSRFREQFSKAAVISFSKETK